MPYETPSACLDGCSVWVTKKAFGLVDFVEAGTTGKRRLIPEATRFGKFGPHQKSNEELLKEIGR